jgi:hypothetical protein
MENNALDAELGLISEEQYAAFVRKKISSVRNERSAGEGPPFVKLGKTIKYPLDGVRKHVVAKTVNPAGEPTLTDARRRRASRQHSAS